MESQPLRTADMGNNQADFDRGSKDSTADSTEVLRDLMKRADTLLSELEDFRLYIKSLRQEGMLEIAHFRGTVQSELNMLQRSSHKLEGIATTHIVRSSNLPFLETVWLSAKRSKDLMALQKRVFLNSMGKADEPSAMPSSKTSHGAGTRSRPDAVILDVITEGGLLWCKCSLVTNTRLLFDLAKQGWESDASEDDTETHKTGDEDDDRDVPLLKTAKQLARASNLVRVRTKHPSVQLILPRIRPGEIDEIDRILDSCRAAGVSIICGEALPPPPTLHTAFMHMAPNPFDSFSQTLNIDCTILLALVSDFSHAKISKEPWFHKALQRQVEIEGNENLLPSLLYPAMRARQLVCTEEAARRMREIVDTIGTTSEKARTVIMLGDDKSRHPHELIEDMQNWSAYPVPTCWQLPIRIVEQNEHDCLRDLPAEALHVSKDMTDINKSVFLYGWARNFTTITSNRTVVKQIESGLNANTDLHDRIWPKIYLCPTARSLVGKEKRGTAKEDKVGGSWPLPDLLRREQQRRNGLDVLSMREGHLVEDFRPNGYPCEEVLAAKNAAQR